MRLEPFQKQVEVPLTHDSATSYIIGYQVANSASDGQFNDMSTSAKSIALHLSAVTLNCFRLQAPLLLVLQRT